MHHHNCFVLEALANELKPKIVNHTLIDCYSNTINEITFLFESFVFKSIFFNGVMYFDFDQNNVSKSRLFNPQFADFINQKVTDVRFHPFERSFQMEFENNHFLLFKCHGRQSNVIGFVEEENTSIFKKNIERDNDMLLTDFHLSKQIQYNETVADLPSFNKAFPSLPNAFYSLWQQNQTEETFYALIHQFKNIKEFKYNLDELLLIPVFYGENNVLNSLSQYTYLSLKKLSFDTQKESLLNRKEKLLADKKAYLLSAEKAIVELTNTRNQEEIGHIILSNMHQIINDGKEQLLYDIYNDCNIVVKYNPDLSAHENADKYFRKSKGKNVNSTILEGKIKATKQLILDLEKETEIIRNSNDTKNLKPFSLKSIKSKAETELPYKLFENNGYSILVGKHAESNDKILSHFSDKNDIWLHAKDVGGSHVLIKNKNKQPIPESIIEKAAELAAYFSKNRKQNLVTVTYTFRKFVRKIKGADKGKVTVSNEKTLLVNPKIL